MAKIEATLVIEVNGPAPDRWVSPVIFASEYYTPVQFCVEGGNTNAVATRASYTTPQFDERIDSSGPFSAYLTSLLTKLLVSQITQG